MILRLMLLACAFFAPGSLANPVPAGGVKAPPQSRTDGDLPRQYFYYSTARSTLETAAHSMPPDDAERLSLLRAWFAKEGCAGNLMTLQAVWLRHGKGATNLICAWPGDSPFTIVVVAHYARNGKGNAAVDGWSGAAMLPFLYLAIQAQPRVSTWVFLESSGKEGTEEYVKLLSRQQKQQIRAVIALDGLGVAPAARFFAPAEQLVSPVASRLQSELLIAAALDQRVPTPVPTNPQFWLTEDDTARFRWNGIPAILIHSVPEAKDALPGSRRDTAAAIDGNAYYQNYRALSIYCVALDRVAARLATQDAY